MSAAEARAALASSEQLLRAAGTAAADRALVRAQVHATLALVEEQRTANLIAAFERDAVQPPADTHIANGTRQAWWNGVADQITERLGLA
ncbi:hypothetical protein [Curtobacterium sp. VKM Ac-2884]|uniref:hypothetical protein n=1 Tax=Curtobacterium sp. VKM Ac-2884 TaxID=2783818 RepID=UPI00188D833B|nr:hypothetical protein [Curtobacterium sp. VKM Ac-2884]MBF4602798.1 hypothetical protein [Curtobacterium sp. VKM Ac-2884]